MLTRLLYRPSRTVRASSLFAAGMVVAAGLVGGAARSQAPPTKASASPEPPSDRRRTFVYGGTAVFRPFDFLDDAGQPQGFNVELVRALARVAGHRVEVKLGDWDTILAGVRSREIDLVMLAHTDERTKTFGFLDEFWIIRHSILFPPGRTSYPSVLLDLKKETVAVSGEALSLQLLRALPDALRPRLITVKDNATAIGLLERGEATAVTGNALVLQYELSRLGIHDLHEVIASASSYRLATGKGREAEMAWVGPALQKLRESGEFSALVEKYLAEPRPRRTLRERVQDAGLIALLLSLPFLLVVAWNRSLRGEVEARTSQIREAAVEKDRLAKSLAESLGRIQEANQKLELKNGELERFTHTVSHDLRSPLVTIRGYLGQLEKSAAEGNLGRFREDAARIGRAVDRMGGLLSDLLELSRVGRVVKPDQAVSIEEVATEAVELLHGMLSENHVEVAIQRDLPVVRGDRQRLSEVFQNLVENGAKFSSERTDPRIWIGARPDKDGTVFTVRDNGIGIDPKHQERIFELFEKLSAESQGTGLGLALVKRIVEAHGGRVWVESPGLGLGSTFCFTLRLAG